MAGIRRQWTRAERVELVSAYRASGMRLDAFARERGVSASTLWNWVNGRSGAIPALPSSPAPQMLEVVQADVARSALAEGRCRLVLGEQAWLDLAGLPPARWVAEVAAELRRC